jgi:signal transduction histidine kinase
MDTIKRWRWRPDGLHWRIIVSYFLVTLVAALTIELAMTIGAFVQGLPQEREPISQMFNQSAELAQAQLAPYLEQTPIDRAALQSWLLQTFLSDVSTTPGGEPAFVAIVDRSSQPLAAASCPLAQSSVFQQDDAGPCMTLPDAQARTLLAPTSTQASLHAALQGTQEHVQTSGTANQATIAIPVFSASRQVLGALVVKSSLKVAAVSATDWRNIGKLTGVFLDKLQPTALYFILLATALGTVTGILISGDITRRLRRIMLATTAWSRGEFQIAVFDRSGDEIGQLARDLNRMAGQLQSLLTARQELAVLEERHRMARDLHDSVKQQVFANSLLIRAARKMFPRNPDRAQAYLTEAEELAVQTQQELSALISALRPAAIADKGLVAALRDYASDWQRRMGIEVKLHTQGTPITPLESEETLFRVAQEALANVAHHSQARQVEIDLTWSGDQVHLSIRDNGKGFDLARASGKGVGLASMRERVEALHGTLLMSSSPTGTTIEAFTPLTTPVPQAAEETHE